jgi:hypothetical protein
MNPKFKVVADDGLNVRSGPGVGYNRLEVLSLGRVVEEVLIPDWCPLATGSGAVGWVSRKYLVPYEDVPPIPGQITGEMLLQAAEAMIGRQKYVLGADSPLKQGDNYTGPTDCAEFISERVQEVTGIIYGALMDNPDNPEPWTGQWKAELDSGRLIGISVEQAIRTPGAILLRFDKQVQHIVFSDGFGRTVEAMGANYGVTRGQARGRGFKYGILIPGVEYKESV